MGRSYYLIDGWYNNVINGTSNATVRNERNFFGEREPLDSLSPPKSLGSFLVILVTERKVVQKGGIFCTFLWSPRLPEEVDAGQMIVSMNLPLILEFIIEHLERRLDSLHELLQCGANMNDGVNIFLPDAPCDKLLKHLVINDSLND
jgi:hypothetical protein